MLYWCIVGEEGFYLCLLVLVNLRVMIVRNSSDLEVPYWIHTSKMSYKENTNPLPQCFGLKMMSCFLYGFVLYSLVISLYLPLKNQTIEEVSV